MATGVIKWFKIVEQDRDGRLKAANVTLAK